MKYFVRGWGAVEFDERSLREATEARDACLFDALLVSGVAAWRAIATLERTDGVSSVCALPEDEDEARLSEVGL